jgi:hypothetical protein
MRRAYCHDFFMAQPAEALLAEFERLAGFSRVVARLGARVQRRPSLQALALKVHAIGDAVSGKEENLPARIGIATVDGFRVLFAIGAGRDRKGGDWQGSADHNSDLYPESTEKVARQ